MKKILKSIVRVTCLSLALALFGINIYSLFFYKVTRNPAANVLPSADTVLNQLSHLQKPSDHYFSYAKQVTHLFHQGIHHYWVDGTLPNEKISLPFLKNWSLYILQNRRLVSSQGHLQLGQFFHSPLIQKPYAYPNYEDAIQRGVGECSANALALMGYMEKQKLSSYGYGFPRHTINQTTFPNGKTYTLDPDYDVVLPFDIHYAGKHPDEVKRQYIAQGAGVFVANKVAQIFSTETGHVMGLNSIPKYRKHEVINWVTPIVLLIAACFI